MTGPASSGPRSFDHHPHPKSQRLAREEVVKTESLSCLNFPSFSLSFRDLFLRGAEEGRQSLSIQAKGSWGAISWGIYGETQNSPPALRPLCSSRFFGCRPCCL